MSVMNNTSDRLRRATQLWHAYLTATGNRFELAQFLKDPAFEKQTIDSALASGDQKLAGLAQAWLLGTGRAVQVAPRVMPPSTPATNAPAEPGKPGRYLRGVR